MAYQLNQTADPAARPRDDTLPSATNPGQLDRPGTDDRGASGHDRASTATSTSGWMTARSFRSS